MKKTMSMISALLLSAALAGCGATATQPAEDTAETPVPAAEIAETETESEIEAKPEAETEDASEALSEENTETAPVTPAAAENADISAAIDAETTTDASAVPLGQWIKTAQYSTEDSGYHTIYARITKVTTQTDDASYIDSAVEQHNACSYDFQQLDLSGINLPDDVELCIVDYEVYVPEEFPEGEFGISNLEISFTESNIGGGGIPSADGSSSYIGLGSNTEDLSLEAEPEYHAGGTYPLRSLYTMVKGYTDYVFDFTTFPDGTTDTSSATLYHGYLSCK